MDLDVIAESEKNLPKHLQGKICPLRKALEVPAPNPLNPKNLQINIQPWGCYGEICAIWDWCQGDNSPKAHRNLIENLVVKAKEFFEPVLKRLSENRLLSGILGL